MSWNWPSVWADERGGWWRVTLTFILLGIPFFIIGAILSHDLPQWEIIKSSGINELIKRGGASLQAGLWMLQKVFPLCFSGLGCALGIFFIHRKPLGCVITDGRPFGFILFLQSALVWGVLWLAGALVFPGGLDDLRQRYHELGHSWPGVFGAIFMVLMLQAATEEIFIRGYIQTRVAAWVKRPWLALFVSTVAFTVLHTGHINTAARVWLAIMGFALGLAAIRANTIAPLIGMHAASNALGVTWLPNWTNANRNWLDVFLMIIQTGFWLIWVFWITKHRARSSDSGMAQCGEASERSA